jgi:hypothetical protein
LVNDDDDDDDDVVSPGIVDVDNDNDEGCGGQFGSVIAGLFGCSIIDEWEDCLVYDDEGGWKVEREWDFAVFNVDVILEGKSDTSNGLESEVDVDDQVEVTCFQLLLLLFVCLLREEGMKMMHVSEIELHYINTFFTRRKL